MPPKTNAAWALESANKAIAEFSTAGAIDTANYQHCSFFLAAAEVVRQDPALLEKVGALMEPPRPGTGDEA